MKNFIKKLLPPQLLSLYHYLLNYVAALRYGFPAKKMTVILVTGTKGKSTVIEMLESILHENNTPTAVISTIRFTTPKHSARNMLKMTMPGRGRIQRILAQAKSEGATHAIIEATSEGAKQFRHTSLFPNVLVFTNLQKEHIESHGSFENYLRAKLSIARELARSPKKNKAIVANQDDPHGEDFLTTAGARALPFSKRELGEIVEQDTGISFQYNGTTIQLQVHGVFNALNALASIKVAEYLNVPFEIIHKGLSVLASVRGRVEFIREGQSFDVVVDYAHTPDSLRALYETFKHKKTVCVLGNTGGGRDTWKRPEMGRIAEQYCDTVILTNEDPYDEDPEKILADMVTGMKKEPLIILDREKAIEKALDFANKNSAVLITGKGTDPYIMEAHGKKTSWDDATVVRDLLKNRKNL